MEGGPSADEYRQILDLQEPAQRLVTSAQSVRLEW